MPDRRAHGRIAGGSRFLDDSSTPPEPAPRHQYKWQVRELGRHQSPDVIGFFTKWSGRLLFGSDIVSMEAHLEPTTEENVMAAKASGRMQAFDLYASRYWALRTMFEGDGEYESPIADPDLHMIDPEAHGPEDAPTVRCHGFDTGLLRTLYRDSALGHAPDRLAVRPRRRMRMVMATRPAR